MHKKGGSVSDAENRVDEPSSGPLSHAKIGEAEERSNSLLKIANSLVETSQQLLALNSKNYRVDDSQTSFLLAINRSKDEGETDLIDYAKRAYDERRQRDAIFNDPDLFGEPGWDILLDLMHAEHKGKRISVTSACIGSTAPPTTALRWIKILESKGLIERFIDERDGRRNFIRLSHSGLMKMRSYFRATRGPS